MKTKPFRVWHAGGHDVEDGVIVSAETPERAAQLGAARLFEPEDPIDRFDVFVRSAHAKTGPAERFAILVDVTRVRIDEAEGTSRVESAEFTPCRVEVAPASLQA